MGTVDIGKLPDDFARAEIRFEDLKLPKRSFELRVFLGETNPRLTTQTTGNPHYLGSQHFFGVGQNDEQAPSEEYARAEEQQFSPTEIRLNVTSGLRTYLATHPSGMQVLSVVAVDRGLELTAPGLLVGRVTLVATQ